MVLVGDTGPILVDTAVNPVVVLRAAGIDHNDLKDVILTHFHPDHVAGFSILLMQTWLLGRRAPLRVYGLNHCLNRVEDMMLAFNWDSWPNFFPVAFHRVRRRPGAFVMENEDFRISAAPGAHYIPTIGLRYESKRTGKVIAYSCDTSPSDNIIELARDADILIHEAEAGESVFGHSSAEQAGEVAKAANAKRLVLIHYKVLGGTPDLIIPRAKSTFDGPVELAEDGSVYDF
jgi:ribonuclease Z